MRADDHITRLLYIVGFRGHHNLALTLFVGMLLSPHFTRFHQDVMGDSQREHSAALSAARCTFCASRALSVLPEVLRQGQVPWKVGHLGCTMSTTCIVTQQLQLRQD
jgi:hypothetical protein